MGSTVNNSSQIDGIITTELCQVSDERGAVLHMLRCDALGFVRFGECYFSEVLPNAIKAWKRPPRPDPAPSGASWVNPFGDLR